VTDAITGDSGTIVLNSKYGPLLPLYSTQQIGNALGGGLVDDTPNSFVWEIGHTSNFTNPAAQLCDPGQTDCTYPWYASNSAYGAITYGASYPGTKSDYGQGSRSRRRCNAAALYGPDSTYCDTVLKPPPLS